MDVFDSLVVTVPSPDKGAGNQDAEHEPSAKLMKYIGCYKEIWVWWSAAISIERDKQAAVLPPGPWTVWERALMTIGQKKRKQLKRPPCQSLSSAWSGAGGSKCPEARSVASGVRVELNIAKTLSRLVPRTLLGQVINYITLKLGRRRSKQTR